MKILIPKLINTYSCQVCQKSFETEEDLIITEGQSPLCSSECEFKLKHRILNKYPNDLLRIFWISFYPKDLIPATRTDALNKLTKYFCERNNG